VKTHMRSHELAKGLRALAAILDRAPDSDLSTLQLNDRDTRSVSSSQIAVNLSTLAELARIDKQQWLTFVREYNLPIDTRPRDAARDILGKVLTYLDTNDDARRALKEKATKRVSETSPELMRAFAFLLKDVNKD
jgi:hypothetical protein